MSKEEFIEDTVLGWIKHDLTKMVTTIRPEPYGKGNINFPLALCTLVYMEYLGGFLLGQDKSYAENVGIYISECFPNKEEYPIGIVSDIFRHGLVHDYFPHGAVSRNGKRPAVYKGNNYDVVLDAETLVNDFIASLEIFASKLDNTKYEKRIEQAKKEINKKKKRRKDLIDSLECQPNDGVNATPSHAAPETDETSTNTSVSEPSGTDKSMHTTQNPYQI